METAAKEESKNDQASFKKQLFLFWFVNQMIGLDYCSFRADCSTGDL